MKTFNLDYDTCNAQILNEVTTAIEASGKTVITSSEQNPGGSLKSFTLVKTSKGWTIEDNNPTKAIRLTDGYTADFRKSQNVRKLLQELVENAPENVTVNI